MTSVATPATSLDASLHGTWNLDRTHSHIEFAVRHMGVATFRGSFADVDATFTADAGSVQLSGSAQARSITTADENLHGHLMSPEFFDVEHYAAITFAAASLQRTGDDVQLDGILTIKDTSLPVTLTGTMHGPLTDPYGNERIGFELDTEIDRTAFGLVWNAPLPGGGWVLSKTVRLRANLEFIAS